MSKYLLLLKLGRTVQLPPAPIRHPYAQRVLEARLGEARYVGKSLYKGLQGLFLLIAAFFAGLTIGIVLQLLLVAFLALIASGGV